MARARLVLLWEDLWRAFWPVPCVIGLFAALALLDVLPYLPGWLHTIVLIGLGVCLIWTVIRAFRMISVPDRTAAERRLESASGLDHRPLQVMSDRLAAGAANSASSDLWEIHKQRMAEAARKLKAGPPSPGGRPDSDRIALRAAVIILLVIGGVVGWADPEQRFARAVNPQIGFLAKAAAPKLEIWITPPEYTRLAPIFPKAENRPEGAQQAAMATTGEQGTPAEVKQPNLLAVPEGSKVVARVAGGNGLPSLVLGTEQRVAFETVDEKNSQVEATISRGDRLVIEQDGKTLGSWPMTVVKDAPPAIAFARPPAPTKGATLAIAYTAADDYGLEQTRVEIRRTYEGGAVVGQGGHGARAPAARRKRQGGERDQLQRSRPPCLGRSPGHHAAQGRRCRRPDVPISDDVKLTLPEREFRHPIARAIIEQRKRLTTEPERRRSIFRRLGRNRRDGRRL